MVRLFSSRENFSVQIACLIFDIVVKNSEDVYFFATRLLMRLFWEWNLRFSGTLTQDEMIFIIRG